MNYYNEHDPKAAEWLRELIRQGHIPAGEVDTRSIRDVCATDLVRFTQCHFFAGIGGWSLALRLAGWPDDEPVWTGSCPCQPFSAAGKQMGTADSRHLWPAFRRLILHGAPPVVIGEQVASALGREWLAGVRANLETMGYAVGAADLCAAGVGAPHIRQRLFWVADADGGTRYGSVTQPSQRPISEANGGNHGGLADVLQPGLEGHAGHGDDGHEPGRNGAQATGPIAESGRAGGGLAESREQMEEIVGPRGRAIAGQCGDPEYDSDACPFCGQHYDEHDDSRCERTAEHGGLGNAIGDGEIGTGRSERELDATGALGFWSAYDLIPCADGKARRIEPGTFPLAYGVPGRVGLLRGYGNAIVPQVAAQFIQAYLEAKELKIENSQLEI